MKRWNILFVFFSLFFIFNCALMEKAPVNNSPCMGVAEGESVICDITPNPQDVDFLLRLGNAAAIKNDVYKATQALATVDALITLLSVTETTYDDVYVYVTDYVDPVIFLIVEEYINRFADFTIPVYTKDREMMLTHLKRQRSVIMMSMPKGGK